VTVRLGDGTYAYEVTVRLGDGTYAYEVPQAGRR
jgi:hypothetical protein